MRAKIETLAQLCGVPMAETAEYPTRYAAFDAPGVLVELAQHIRDTGRAIELAVYHEPMENVRYPHITDGIYFEVQRHWNGAIWLSAQSSRPDASRAQLNRSRRCYGGVDEALCLAFDFLQEARAFCGVRR